jgi:hypothetical protein
MKKIKNPWYGALWIFVWTAALIWFLASGMFDTRESAGLVLVWLILVGANVYLIVLQSKQRASRPAERPLTVAAAPALNSPCPCGSGKKYKRCCGAKAQ